MTSVLKRMDVFTCSVAHFPTILQEAMAAVMQGRAAVEAIIHCDIYNSEEWLWSLAFRAEGEMRTKRYKLDMDVTGPPEFHDNHLWFPVDWRSNSMNDTYAALLPGKYCDSYNNPGQPKFPGFICEAEDGRDLVGVANCMEELIETCMNEFEKMKASEEEAQEEPPKVASLPRTSDEEDPCNRKQCCGNEYKRKYWTARKGADGQWSYSCKCSKPGSDIGIQVDMPEGVEEPWEDDEETCSDNSEESQDDLFRATRPAMKRMNVDSTRQRIPYQKLTQEDQSEGDVDEASSCASIPGLVPFVPYDDPIEPQSKFAMKSDEFGYNAYAKECYFKFNLLPLLAPPEAPAEIQPLETGDKKKEEDGPVLPNSDELDELVSAHQLNGKGADSAANYAMSILSAQEGQPPMELPKRVKLETVEDFESALKTEIERAEEIRAGLVKKMSTDNDTDVAKLDSYRKTLEMRMDEMKNAEETLKSVHSDYEQMAKVLQSTMEAITMNFFESCADAAETKAEIEVTLKN